MIELEQALAEEAARILPAPNLDDVFRRIRRRRHRARLAAGAAVAGLTLIAGLAFVTHRGSTKAALVTTSGPSASLPGVTIDGGPVTPGNLERRDPTAGDGPATIVVRGPGGSFAHESAVITFPVDPVDLGTHGPTTLPSGTVIAGSITWALAGSYARVRGDLGAEALAAIVPATSVDASGHLQLDAPAGLTIDSSEPYWPAVEREHRYGSQALGEDGPLGPGLTWVGLTSSAGGLEDEVFARGVTGEFTVNGVPAVAVESSNPNPGTPTQLSGNGELIWEPQPGVAVVVGYSGNSFGPAAIDALVRLAGRVRLLSDAEWSATNPQITTRTHPSTSTATTSTSAPN